MEFVFDSFIWLVVLGVTLGIVFGVVTSFIRVGFTLWKYVFLVALIVWVIQLWN